MGFLRFSSWERLLEAEGCLWAGDPVEALVPMDMAIAAMLAGSAESGCFTGLYQL